MIKTIYIFGNPDLDFDSLPFRILPELKKRFPKIDFETKDPNEELEMPEELVIIDTVKGIKQPHVFSKLSDLAGHPNISVHDFDLYSHLKLLEKLGRIKKIKIIGIPPSISESEAIEEVSLILRQTAKF
ncbi:MAG: hypothetical protein UX07_C0005G0011 [Parcubacteria group bacterium GW2011_GWA2_45_30]|nr:MAG: hypothetical protein UX07_C0005G0011 [Parcubacteria group bacterium GW2011_GWA2_45_30]